jgi:hypothetical protein
MFSATSLYSMVLHLGMLDSTCWKDKRDAQTADSTKTSLFWAHEFGSRPWYFMDDETAIVSFMVQVASVVEHYAT